LSDKLVQLNGRILRQEMIKGNQSQCSYNYDADWSKKIQNLPMYRTVILKKWLVIFPSGNKSAVEEFISTLRNIAKKLNFDLPQPIMSVFVIFIYSNTKYTITFETFFFFLEMNLILMLI